jgi:hypothetical protein
MTTKENYDRAMQNVHPHIAAYIKHNGWAWIKGKFQSQDVLVFCREVSSEDECDIAYMGYDGEILESQHYPHGTSATAEELINKFIEELSKSPDEVVWNAGGH